MTVEFCNEARLYAVVNEEDQKILEFQWFKFNTNSSQFEYISGTVYFETIIKFFQINKTNLPIK